MRGLMMETTSQRMGRIGLDGNRPLTEENAEPGFWGHHHRQPNSRSRRQFKLTITEVVKHGMMKKRTEVT
jgi:hypothetical protein